MTEEKQKTESNASPTIHSVGLVPCTDERRRIVFNPEDVELTIGAGLGVTLAESITEVTTSSTEIAVVNARANVETALVATACPNPGEIAMCIETLIRAVLAERLSGGRS